MPYRLEICPSNRAKCQGPVCNKNDTKISKGDVRLGVLVEFGEHQSFKWRHVWCITKRQFEGIKKEMGDDPADVDGYEELDEDQQQMFADAFKRGEIDEAEAPEHLQKAWRRAARATKRNQKDKLKNKRRDAAMRRDEKYDSAEDEAVQYGSDEIDTTTDDEATKKAKDKKAAADARKKKKEAGGAPQPKKAKKPKASSSKTKVDESEEEPEADMSPESDAEEDMKPKAKKGKATKKKATKKQASDAEDDGLTGDEAGDEEVMPAGKDRKRGRPAKQAASVKQEQAEAGPSSATMETTDAAPKRKGRPRKNVKQEEADGDDDAEQDEPAGKRVKTEQHDDLPEVAPKKQRGRPKKNVEAASASDQAGPSTSATNGSAGASKRGRPKKVKNEEEDGENGLDHDDAAQDSAAPAKRRGRPKKAVKNEPEEDE